MFCELCYSTVCLMNIPSLSFITSGSHHPWSSSNNSTRLNGEWHVYDTDAIWNLTVLDCCPGKGYPHVVFILHLRRRNKFYMMNIVLPCIMLSVLIMIGFFLPPDAGEKISLGISVLLAFTVFLLMIADNIPRTSLAIPLMGKLVQYYVAMLECYIDAYSNVSKSLIVKHYVMNKLCTILYN